MLVRLMYASRVTTPGRPDDLLAILKQSRANNPAHGLTGLLCCSDTIFLQVIEGGRSPVNRLYHRIAADPRHHDLLLLIYEEIDERAFAGWSMGQIDLARLNPALLLKYSEAAELDPYAVSGKVSLALFNDLVAYMTSGPVIAQVLEGENAVAKHRDIMGATDPKKAAPGTIRADFAQSIDANAVHGSDAPETAAVEIAYFFPASQVYAR